MTTIVADIGGTNARFACLSPEGKPVKTHKLACREYAGFEQALRHYLELAKCETPERVCAAVACPTEHDCIALTNSHWKFSVSATVKQLNLKQFLVINDFDALARSVLYLQSSDLATLIPGEPMPYGVKALIGPGTGLGTGGLVWSGERWTVISGEGGYVTLPIRTDRDIEVWKVIRHRYGRVSAERLLCGNGLIELYTAICELEHITAKELGPADVVATALENSDSRCHEALAMFCAFLGDVCGDYALGLGAMGGVYLGGGIPPRIVEFLQQSEFKDRFLSRGRGNQYIEQMPVFIITADTPALWGCAHALEETQVSIENG